MLVAQAARLVAEQPCRGTGQRPRLARSEKVGALDVGGDHLHADRLGALDHALQLVVDGDRKVEQRPGGRANHLRVVEVDAATGEDDRVGTGGIRGTNDRAGVARVAHLLEDRDELRLPGENVLHRGGELTADGDNPLRSDSVGHRLEHLFGDELDLEVGLGCGSSNTGVALQRRGGREEVDNELGAEGQSLRYGLGSLQEKKPGLRPGFSLSEFCHSAHPR